VTGVQTCALPICKLSKLVRGSHPKIIGSFRWSQKNESAVFTTYSDDGVKVVIVISMFDDDTFALKFFSDDSLSETDTFENISSFTYADDARELHEMAKDIKWVWKTVDDYKASWGEASEEP
jgi:hypothetical protein